MSIPLGSVVGEGGREWTVVSPWVPWDSVTEGEAGPMETRDRWQVR